MNTPLTNARVNWIAAKLIVTCVLILLRVIAIAPFAGTWAVLAAGFSAFREIHSDTVAVRRVLLNMPVMDRKDPTKVRAALTADLLARAMERKMRDKK